MRAVIPLLLLLASSLTACVTPASSVISQTTREKCGATFSLQRGDLATSDLYAVSVYPEPGRSRQIDDFPTDSQVKSFIDANTDVLSRAQNNVGTFCERESGDCRGGSGQLTCWLDITRTETSLERAIELARACNQKSIARLGRTGVVIIDQHEGKPLGDGKPLEGADLERCMTLRR